MLTVSVLWFSARALKKNIFFDVDVVVKKKKSKCGFSWSVLLPTTSRCHYITVSVLCLGRKNCYVTINLPRSLARF